MKKMLIVTCVTLVVFVILELFDLKIGKTEQGYNCIIVVIIFTLVILAIVAFFLIKEIKSCKRRKDEVSDFVLNHGTAYIPKKL